MEALVEIKRFEHDAYKANRGVVFLNKEFFGFSLERPNKNNMPNLSRINAGPYTARKVNTKKRGNFWLLDDANGRTEIILFHPGSLMTDFEGCIGLGAEIGKINGERAIFETRLMCSQFLIETSDYDILKVIIT